MKELKNLPSFSRSKTPHHYPPVNLRDFSEKSLRSPFHGDVPSCLCGAPLPPRYQSVSNSASGENIQNNIGVRGDPNGLSHSCTCACVWGCGGVLLLGSARRVGFVLFRSPLARPLVAVFVEVRFGRRGIPGNVLLSEIYILAWSKPPKHPKIDPPRSTTFHRKIRT